MTPPSDRSRTVRTVFRWLLGGLFVVAGVAHFARPDEFARSIPPYFPEPEAIVYVSGVCELVLGLLALVPRTAPADGWGLVALLIVVFPANVHMARHPELFPHLPPVALGARLPLQA